MQALEVLITGYLLTNHCTRVINYILSLALPPFSFNPSPLTRILLYKGKSIMKRIIITLLVLGYLPILLIAQEPYAELQKIMDLYQGDRHIALNINYEFYENLNATQPSDSLRMDMVRKGTDFYVDAELYEMLNHEGVGLVVNHEDKIIVLQDNLPEPVFNLEQLEVMAKQNGLQLDFFTPNQLNTKGLRFAAPEHSETQIDFIYDANTYQLREVITKIKVPEEQYQTEFNNTKIRAVFSNYRVKEAAFPHRRTRFISKNNTGKIQAIGKYRNYRIIES